jgi:apolipoprotein D and lipocalin family protein|tara:strand:+ start:10907 stop:11467 length:561 start_codon:yes stop_codon:yes gene_type:complete
MKILLTLAIATLLVSLTSCSNSPLPLRTVQNLELDRYDGEWHEVSRLPNRFEKGIVAAKATYGVGLDGPISVRNKGLKANGKLTSISGSASVVGDGKLKVRFDPFPLNLFLQDYWILWINQPYTKAIVGSPNRKFLWLLSKNPSVITSDFTEPLQLMEAQGFEIEKLIENPKRLAPDPQPPLLVTF